jgi:hypothetical protein
MLTTERSIQFCKKNGWRVGKVEMWVPKVNIRRDLFGWMDLLVWIPEEKKWVGVQSCAMQHRADHLEKIKGRQEIQDALTDWLSIPGHDAELWSWRKLKVKRGGKAVRWEMDRTKL